MGRAEELAVLRRLRSSQPPVGAILTGPAGVGKSRLAQAALEAAAGEGWATLSVRASAGFAGVPLGPFRTVLHIDSRGGPAELATDVERALMALRSGRGLMVLVDDCQALDDLSAALLHQLVGAGTILCLATARSGGPAVPGLTDLWRDGLVERIELLDLSRRETAELLGAALGPDVQESSLERIWRVTGGNPLYIREVVLSSLESGALREIDGQWRWRGEWAGASRIQEIVSFRLGQLDPDELTVMEMLAVAGALPLGPIAHLTTASATERLEARGLVRIERRDRRLEAAITHPLHAEVVKSRTPALRQQSIRRSLLDAFTAFGARRTADRVRLACWSLESGAEVDPITLALGTEAALFGIGQAISTRLEEIMPGAAVAHPTSRPPVRQDYEVATQLAQTAYDRSGSVLDGVKLSNALAWAGATDRAEAVLTEVAGRTEALDDRLRVALALAWCRFWLRFDTDGARQVLSEALSLAGPDADPLLRADLLQQAAGIELNTARPAAALVLAEQSAATQGVTLGLSLAATPAAAALLYLGRCGQALTLIDEAMAAASQGAEPLTVATLLFSRAGALYGIGRLEEARQLAEWLRDVAVSGELLPAAGLFGTLLGEVLLQQGRPASAGRIFQDACGLLAESDVLGYRPWALSGLARARAMVGEGETAAAALREAHRTQPIVRHFDMSHHLAAIEVHRLAGRTAEALEAARAAVEWARGAGMLLHEARALDAQVRLAPTRATAERLAEVAAITDSEMVSAEADNARALVDRDGAALLAVGERFAAMTAWWKAAEAAGAAAQVLAGQGRARAGEKAGRTAADWAGRCEGALTSAGQAGLTGGPPLTRREREIAVLAAGGRSSKEIAEGMYLSPRTVENHLHHAYTKLGVTDRVELAAALTLDHPSE